MAGSRRVDRRPHLRSLRPRLGLGIAAAAGTLLAGAVPAAATIAGPCRAIGIEANVDEPPGRLLDDIRAGRRGLQGSLFNVDNGTEWHVHQGSWLSGGAAASTQQTFMELDAELFGIGIPVARASGRGTSGAVGPYHVADFAGLLRTVGVGGRSDSCSGSFTVIVDDRNPLTTVTGAGGLGGGIVFTLGVILVGTRRRRHP